MGIFSLLGLKKSKPHVYAKDIVGDSITIRKGGRIIVDGKLIVDNAEGVVELVIREGIVNNITSSAAVTVHGDVQGNVTAEMSVTCGNVGGDVDADMGVTCGNVGGDVDAGMSINCGDIRGSADAGMSIRRK